MKRLPVMLCCVVDTSGSMGCDAVIKDENGKSECHGLSILDLTKHSIKTIVEFLNKKDYLSIVSYSNEAQVVTPLTKMTKKNKRRHWRRSMIYKQTVKPIYGRVCSMVWSNYEH
eukprot:13001_1